jgi:transposase
LYHKFIFNRYQQLLKKYGLVSEEQFVDFSSSYFEGGKSELGELGYSRDGKPGKKQIVFGISTGMNNVPTALTVQKGNVQDKKHFRLMLKIVKKVLPEDSALIFDCGGNTKENKVKVRKLGFNYLTLKSKKKGTYKTYISKFKQEKKEKLVVNNISYKCVKFVEENEIKYMFYSEKLAKEQTKKRKKKFSKELEKNEVKLRKTKKGKALAKYISKEGLILAKGELQKLLSLENPYITGLEGYFILESSIDTSPEKILKLYKEKDKAEKLIRNMKEGTELRPMRHCTELAIIGYLTIIFLTNCLTNLTLFLSKKPDVKNVKLLKKYLNNLTLTIVYPKNRFRFTIISNISQEIRSIFGNYIDKYEDKSLELRW